MLDTQDRPIHFGLTRTTDATLEPLDLTEAETWLRISDSHESTIVDGLIRAARQKVETDTGLALLTQTWTWTIDAIPDDGVLWVPVAPLASVTSVKTFDTASAETTVATSVYRVDTQGVPGRIVLKDGQSWPSGLRPQNGVQVVFVAGWTSVDAIPANLVHAMRLLVAHWFAQREPVVPGTSSGVVDLTYEALVAPYRLLVTW